MKLLRYRSNGIVALGAAASGGIVPLASLGCPHRTMLALIEAGPDALKPLQDAIGGASAELPLDESALLAPIEKPGKYLAIGMNYGKHLEEADRLGIPRAKHQIWFNKQTTCLNAPFGAIEPGPTEQLDYEVELGVVIGTRARRVEAADAAAHVFGYFVANDVSARDYQFHSQTMTMGKSFDTHGPIGPWIVTADEIGDPHALALECRVNGALRQSSNTRHMIADIWQQIAYLTSAFTLEPGDLLATGTPEGVGVGMDPPCFLQSGDLVRCEIEKIGAIANRVA